MDTVEKTARLRGAVACIVAVAALPTLASQVLPVNLEQMTERAGRIFAGRCVETRVVLDPQLGRLVTVATFEVERAVKGEIRQTVSVRMIGGGDPARGPDAGVPRFRAGEEVVLFLYGETALGLSSPVGLGQGRFSVLADKQGRRIAVNDFANENLLRGLTPAAQVRLGSSLAEWKDRKDLAPAALLDMVEALGRP